jgi:uncharacterized membrane protein (DUF485 family)
MSITSLDLTGNVQERSEFLDLVQARLRVATLLSLVMVVSYFGFMAMFAFNKPLLGTMVTPYLSVAMLIGPALILMPIVLCGIYVVWTSRVYDPAVKKFGWEARR